MIILTLLIAALLGAAIALVARAVALPRLRSSARVDQIQAYGFAATAAPVVEAKPSSRPVASLASWLGDRLAPRLGVIREQALRTELMAAGMYRTHPRLLMGYRAIAAAALALLGWFIGGTLSTILAPLFAIYFGFTGWILPLTFVRRRATARLRDIDRSLPDLIDLLVVTVEAGLGFAASLQVCAGRLHGPLAAEVRLALQEQQMGVGNREALEHLQKRADTPAIRSFVRSIIQGESLGVPIGTIMRNLAAEMRVRRRAAAEEQAQKAPTKILFPLVFLILPSLIVVLLGPAGVEIIETLKGQ